MAHVVAVDCTIVPTIVASKVGVPLMIHCRRTSEREVKTPTPHKPLLSSCISSYRHSNLFFSSQDIGICFNPKVVRSLLCVSRTDMLGFCGCSVIALRIATAVLGRRMRSISIPLYYTAHQTLRGFAVPEDRHFSLEGSTLRSLSSGHRPR